MMEQRKADGSDNRQSSSQEAANWAMPRSGRKKKNIQAATRLGGRSEKRRKHKDRSSWQGEAESAGRYAGFERARGDELRLRLLLLLLLTWPRDQDLALPVANAEPCAVEQTKGKGSGGRDGGVLGSGRLCYNNKSASSCHSAVGLATGPYRGLLIGEGHRSSRGLVAGGWATKYPLQALWPAIGSHEMPQGRGAALTNQSRPPASVNAGQLSGLRSIAVFLA
ncbi:hypothetical protein MKX08_010023 [Trichoderma sp. CBMAI-0020]|nr:hypothetical protein MKX08_010023 [Trichoderma sp. CBMAI-0020]